MLSIFFESFQMISVTLTTSDRLFVLYCRVNLIELKLNEFYLLQVTLTFDLSYQLWFILIVRLNRFIKINYLSPSYVGEIQIKSQHCYI